MFQAISYTNVVEYLRRVEEVSVTEEGNYLKGEIPEDYSGSILTMEVVHEVLLADESGQILQQLFNPPKALDKEGNPSVGLTIDGEVAEAGDTPTELTTKFNEGLDPDHLSRIVAMVEHFELPEEGE